MNTIILPGDSNQQSNPSPHNNKTVILPHEKNTSEGSEFLDDATRMDEQEPEDAGFSEE